MDKQPKLLVILGPTSTGKTDLGIGLAKKFNGEIISADSRQVYKYLDIGTGKKPSIKGQVLRGQGYWTIDGIKIWMYDVVEPDIRFNLYQFIIKAEKIIHTVSKRGKLPILVGGTGLYIRSLLEGISDFGVVENSELRQKLEELETGEIIKRIKAINPIVLKTLNSSEINNKRRLIRLYEKIVSGKSFNEIFPGIEKDFDVLKIGLTVSREALSTRIRERVVARIKQGMAEEAVDLLAQEILTYERMEELGLEYRYLGKLINGEIKSTEDFIEILSTKIRQFAKRQMTWFKKEKDATWFDAINEKMPEKVESAVANWYNINNE